MRAPEFWRSAGLLSTGLLPFAALYAAAGNLRRAASRPWAAPVPVICVGNLVVGGAGKTPVALALARLVAAGASPHFLTRGYGGRLAGPVRVDPAVHGYREVGDEALLLAAVAPTWVARDRAAGARAAVAEGAGLIVMDDGLQNHDLKQDLRLVVVDRDYGFGNGRVMPAGPLREPVSAGLARAQAAILIGRDGSPPAGLDRAVPLLHARIVPDEADAPEWAGQRVLAFAGIGRPDKFFASLQEAGSVLVGSVGFADHHRYRDAEIAALIDEASRLQATAVTTSKDWVRLPEALKAEVDMFRVRLAWSGDDEARMRDLIDGVQRMSR